MPAPDPAYSRKRTVLHLFSGPMLREDGLRAQLHLVGWDCSDHDIVNVQMEGESAGDHDLSLMSLWDQLHRDLGKGEYDAVVMGTLCETASKARTGPPGPRPLRSAEHIYGLPRSQLSQAEHEQVKLGTFFAIKSAEIASRATCLGIPWIIENPDPAGNPVSLFNLPEWKSLSGLPEVHHLDLHQCHLGAETAKPIRLLFHKLDLSALKGQ